MLSHLLRRSSLAAALVVLAAASPARAQQEQVTEFQSWRLPGWSFTPGVTIGTMFDSNVAVSQAALPGGSPASDRLFTIQPFGQLEFYDARTTLSSGYGGMVRRYADLTELDGVDHHGYFDLRRMLTRRVTFYTKENYMRVPTTDLLQLNGVPYQRTGSRYNDFSSGVEARLTRTIDLAAEYENQWVDFVRKDTPLTGGFVNGVHASLTERVSGRSSFGAEAGLRWASLAQGRVGFEVVPVTILFQDVGAVYRYQSGRRTLIDAAFGFAHLDDRTRGITRNGPYARAGVTHHAERATLGLTYERSYVPSLSFGGTNQSQEMRGYVQMPLARNRFYVQESAAWRRTNPFIAGELPLDSLWFDTVGGYALQRWVRLEGYYIFTRQETRLPADITLGLITRNMIGVQLVISEPMRIR